MTAETPEISVVVPVHDEAGAAVPLAREIAAAFAGRSYEMIFVDDASRDATLAELKAAREGTNAEDIRAKTNTLVQASMKLGEAMYAQQQGDAAAEGQPADDGVVDAEFEEVSDTDGDDKKSA